MSIWHFNPIFGSYAIVAVLAAALVGLLAVSPAYARLRGVRRWSMLGLRTAVILLVVLAMLRPTRVSSQTQPQTATLILLVDTSRSLQVADDPGGETRWQSLRDCLTQAEPELSAMGESLEVKIYTFDAIAELLPWEGGELDLPVEPLGRETDIATALDEVVRREVGNRLAGVILLSDGAQRAYAPRVDVQQAARELARRQEPLYTITFGVSRDRSQARDVAVENMPDQFTVFVKNELEIRGNVLVQGYVNQNIPVELTLEHPDGHSESLGVRPVTASEDGQSLEVAFSYVPQQAGQYKLTLAAAGQPGELVTENNRLSAYLTVLEGGLRVLYIDGKLNWQEQKFIRRSIDSSPDIQLDFRPVDIRDHKSGPLDLEAEIGESLYDVYLIGDVDAQMLGRENIRALAEEVRQGKGLAMLGGFRSFGPGGYRATALADLLPVRLGNIRQVFDEPILEELHLSGEVPMLPKRLPGGGTHYLMRLAAEEENEEFWAGLPPLLGANDFEGIKPLSQVLAESPEGEPLLVVGEAGGRVLAFAGDSSYRWWRHGYARQHKRFWRQVVLWLARKDETAQDDVWVRLDQRRFPPGARVAFAAGARGADGNVIEDVHLEATAILPDGSHEPASLSAEGEEFAGLFGETSQSGDYVIEVVANHGGREIGKARGNFLVIAEDLELSDPVSRPGQMALLAGITSEYGGRTLAPEQLAELLSEIRRTPPELKVQLESSWTLGDTALDAWVFFQLIIGLLGVQWTLRKKWGLV